MAKYRNNLPQLSGNFFVTNGGLETTLIYHENVQIPYFAAFDVLKDESGCEWMKNYLRKFLDIGKKYKVGFILENAGWRASPDWITKLGYTDNDLAYFNTKSIELLEQVRNEYETDEYPIVLNATIGPRGDGYNPSVLMTPEQAQMYHSKRIGIISQTNADMVTGLTLNYPEEAIGIVRAAQQYGMPVIISFTVETDGHLPTGQTLKEAIQMVDQVTENGRQYYMINCAHPSVIQDRFTDTDDWVLRIHGIKGNASKKSHAELDESKELDDGNPIEFGECNRQLLYRLKNFNIFGGCCGTDCRHLEEICKVCLPTFNQLKHGNY